MQIDTANRETLYDYDTAHRLIKTTDALNKITQFEYNNRSQMTKVKDALNQEYVFTYDALGRILSQTRASSTMSYEYDAVGNRTKRTDYAGKITNYTYDVLNRLTNIAYQGSTDFATFAYDDLSRLSSATNQNGAVSFAYDNRSRIASTTDVFNQAVSYGYDENGNRNLLKINGTNYATYVYDVANRLTSLTSSQDAAQITFGYDNANRLTLRNYPNGVNTTYEYDGMSRLKRLKDATLAATLFDRQYSYNAASQISQIAEPLQTRNFNYDNVDRLASVTNPTATSESYSFDAVGNQTNSHLSASYSYQPFNRLTNTATTSYSYDSNGNMLSKSDTSGNRTFEWDYENRLKKVIKLNGEIIIYKYDALGRRITREKQTQIPPLPPIIETTNFIYDGLDVVQDRNGTGLVTASYLNGLGIDNKLRQTVNGQAQYFLADHLGSTNGLTDVLGNVTAQTNYDSFGNATNANFPTRYQYTGREFDADTGLHYYRARWYDASLGRFISEDPIGFEGGDINLYGYVWNNPQNWIDPMG